MNTLRLVLKTFSLAAIVFSSTVNIATANSLNGSLGDSPAATDFYRITCSKNANGDTDNLKVSLVDLAPVLAPMVSAQVIRGILAKNTTDAVDGDAVTSPAAIVKGGNGVYEVRVNKTAKGIESYKLNYWCFNSKGKVTGIALATAQNQ